MKETRTFRSYNFVTGAVDGTLAYDFSESYAPPRQEPLPGRHAPRRARPAEGEWVREQTRERADRRGGMGLLVTLASLAAGVMLIAMLLAQIRLVDLSDSSAALEQTLAELRVQQDKLTVEYETIFNLKAVEEYAVGVLGMQEPREDQLYYLSDVPSADKAVVVARSDAGALSLGLEDLADSLRAYFKAYFG